jgi:hypothetical protein
MLYLSCNILLLMPNFPVGNSPIFSKCIFIHYLHIYTNTHTHQHTHIHVHTHIHAGDANAEHRPLDVRGCHAVGGQLILWPGVRLRCTLHVSGVPCTYQVCAQGVPCMYQVYLARIRCARKVYLACMPNLALNCLCVHVSYMPVSTSRSA